MSLDKPTPRKYIFSKKEKGFRNLVEDETSKSGSIHDVLSVLTGETPEQPRADIEFKAPFKDLGKDVPKFPSQPPPPSEIKEDLTEQDDSPYIMRPSLAPPVEAPAKQEKPKTLELKAPPDENIVDAILKEIEQQEIEREALDELRKKRQTRDDKQK